MIQLIKVARPQFLIGVLGLFLFGAFWGMFVGGAYAPAALVVGWLTIAAAQMSVHFSNDYFDAEFDKPESAALISGGSGVLVQHPELRKPALRVALACSAISLLLAFLLMRIGEFPWWMMLLAILGNVCGWAYSAPPLRLVSRGLGELCYMLVGGFLVPGMGYAIVRGRLDAQAAIILLPLFLYGLVTMLAVQIPDVEVDRQSDKKTLVSRHGRRFGFTAIGMLLAAAAAYFFMLSFLTEEGGVLRALGWLALLPAGIGAWGLIQRPQERRAASRLATLIVVGLSAFALVVDGYLLWWIISRA